MWYICKQISIYDDKMCQQISRDHIQVLVMIKYEQVLVMIKNDVNPIELLYFILICEMDKTLLRYYIYCLLWASFLYLAIQLIYSVIIPIVVSYYSDFASVDYDIDKNIDCLRCNDFIISPLPLFPMVLFGQM